MMFPRALTSLQLCLRSGLRMRRLGVHVQKLNILTFEKLNGASVGSISQGTSSNKNNAKKSPLGYTLIGLGGLSLLLWLGLHQHRESNLVKPFSIRSFFTVDAASPFFGGLDKNEDDGNSDRKPPIFNFNFIADVVEKVAPAVVYIEINDLRRRDLSTGKHLSISNGSGFFVATDGLILTNAHVVENRPRMSNITVRLSDGRSYNATVEDIDRDSDLATLRIPVDKVPTLPLGNSSRLRPGEWVVAMGSPLSLANTITVGVVSSKGRGGAELGLRTKGIDYIQTDAAITFGNSGGPLINLDGEAIGINSMKVTAGISFAIPSDHARNFLDTINKRKNLFGSDDRRPRRRYMGITMLSLNPQLILELRQRMHDIPASVSHGVLVWKLVVGSPAHKSGLQPGDILVEINGKAIHSAHDVYRAVEAEPTLKVLVVRGNKQFYVSISPEE